MTLLSTTRLPEPVNEPVKSVNFTTLQVKKPSPKMQKALDWLKANSDQAKRSSRDLAPIIGVSHVTVNDAQKELGLK